MNACSCGVLGDNIQQLFRVQSTDRSICLRVSGAVAPSALLNAFLHSKLSRSVMRC